MMDYEGVDEYEYDDYEYDYMAWEELPLSTRIRANVRFWYLLKVHEPLVRLLGRFVARVRKGSDE
jgi:hypothetical protein